MADVKDLEDSLASQSAQGQWMMTRIECPALKSGHVMFKHIDSAHFFREQFSNPAAAGRFATHAAPVTSPSGERLFGRPPTGN